MVYPPVGVSVIGTIVSGTIPARPAPAWIYPTATVSDAVALRVVTQININSSFGKVRVHAE